MAAFLSGSSAMSSRARRGCRAARIQSVSATDRARLYAYDKRPETAPRLMPSVDRAPEHVAGCRYVGMPFALLDRPPCFLRQELLGSEAVYEILEEDDELVTAEVVSAPGLPRGT